MLRDLSPNDPFWESPVFLADEVLFNPFHLILETPGILWESEDGGIRLGQTGPNGTLWIWTPEGLDAQTLQPLAGLVRGAYHNQSSLSVSARPEMIQALQAVYAASARHSLRILHRMLAQHCLRLSEPANHGKAIPAREADPAAFMDFLNVYCQQTQPIPPGAEAVEAKAQQLAASGNACLWLSPEGRIVSLANIAHRSPRHGRINMVFTHPEYRGNGYAGMLVAFLCRTLRAEGRTPMLYTDADYPASNRAYAKIGFTPRGALTQMEILCLP